MKRLAQAWQWWRENCIAVGVLVVCVLLSAILAELSTIASRLSILGWWHLDKITEAVEEVATRLYHLAQ